MKIYDTNWRNDAKWLKIEINKIKNLLKERIESKENSSINPKLYEEKGKNHP